MTAEFRRSSFCGTNACVEVLLDPETDSAIISHSTEPDWGLLYTADEWRAFVSGVKANEFDWPDR